MRKIFFIILLMITFLSIIPNSIAYAGSYTSQEEEAIKAVILELRHELEVTQIKMNLYKNAYENEKEISSKHELFFKNLYEKEEAKSEAYIKKIELLETKINNIMMDNLKLKSENSFLKILNAIFGVGLVVSLL